MVGTIDDWWARNVEYRNRVIEHVKQNMTEWMVHTTADARHDLLSDAFEDLLTNAHEEMLEDLLLTIFNWSDCWSKRIVADILGLPNDDEEYEWEELLENLEAQEQQENPKGSEPPHWTQEGF